MPECQHVDIGKCNECSYTRIVRTRRHSNMKGSFNNFMANVSRVKFYFSASKEIMDAFVEHANPRLTKTA